MNNEQNYKTTLKYEEKSIFNHNPLNRETLLQCKKQIEGLEVIVAGRLNRQSVSVKAETRSESWTHDGDQYTTTSGVSNSIEIYITARNSDDFKSSINAVLNTMGIPNSVEIPRHVSDVKYVFRTKGYVLEQSGREYHPITIGEHNADVQREINNHQNRIDNLRRNIE